MGKCILYAVIMAVVSILCSTAMMHIPTGSTFNVRGFSDNVSGHRSTILHTDSLSMQPRNCKTDSKDKNYDRPQIGVRKRWVNIYRDSSVDTRFPLPERRHFPEVDWRGFNEDVFHESFGDFNPMKRWKRSNKMKKSPRYPG